MSGLSLVGSTLVRRSTMPSHSWRSTFTVTSGYCLANSDFARAIISSGVSGPLSQTRRVVFASLAGASREALPPPSSFPHAASASTAASALAATFGVLPSSYKDSGGAPPCGSLQVSRDAQFPVENEHRGAEEDVVLPERAEPDVDVVADRRHGSGADGVERRGPERLVEHIEWARQDDLAQVERADHRGQRLAQPVAGGGAGRVGALGPLAVEAAAEAGGGDGGL